MSALTNPTPQPVQQPPQRVLRQVQEPPRKPFPWKGWLAFAMVLAGCFAAYQLWLKPAAKPQTAAVVYRTAKVSTGTFQRTLRVGGVTAAQKYAHITAPRLRGPEARNSMELLKLTKDGSWVKNGDTLAEIDPGYLIDHVDDIKSSVVQAELDVARRKSEQAVELETLQQTIRVAKSDLDKAKLEFGASGIRTDIERELLKLDLEEAEARYKQVQLDVPEKRVIHSAEIRILDFTTERHRRHAGRHINDIKAFSILSPMEGLLVVQSMFRGGEFAKVQQGDQVMPGQGVVRVVNPNNMQVEATANQAESSDVRIGQKAMIGFDAFPGLTLSGKVHSIGALAVGGWRQNYFIRNVPLKLNIEGGDPRVIPDLSGYADIVLEEKPNVTLVPIGAVQQQSGKSFVYVKNGDQYSKREVTLGATNNMMAVAESGIKPGEEVRLD